MRDLLVYLPPEYEKGGRFPVVLVLPGFGSTNRSLLAFSPWEPNPVERFDRLVALGSCPPALLVLPDAINRWGGSQYIDSEATGRYQEFIADEVIDLVDARFRTIPERGARAVVGKSSGGFGALRLGMDRPDRFVAVGSHAGDAAFEISLRPMLTTAAIAFERAGGAPDFAARILRTGGPKTAAEWDALFVLAATAAYSPNLALPEPHGELPFDATTAELVPAIWARILAHDPLERVAASADALRSLRLVYLDAGDRDEHGLQFAARLLARAVGTTGAKVEHHEFEGGHRGTGFRYEASLPRLVAVLDHES